MFKDDELQHKLQKAMDNYVKLDLLRVKEYNALVDKYKAKEEECEKLKDRNQYVEGNIEIFENERNELEQKLQAKEQEREELKQWKEDAENLFKTQTDNANKIINRYKQALNEIEKTINEDDFNLCPIDDSCDCHRGLEKDILDIINNAKKGN